MFKVGDYVEVVSCKNSAYKGTRSFIVEFKEKAIGSGSSWPYHMKFYPGWRLQKEMRNEHRQLIFWKENQIRKIDPPDWEAEKRDERKGELA